MSTRSRKVVVAGLIVGADGRILITRRRADQPLGGFWEFPGGKLEPGETPTSGLARELREELGVEVEVGPVWEVLHHAYPEFDLLMLVYACRLAPGSEPRAVEVADLAWCRRDQLADYDILPADAPLVARLRHGPVDQVRDSGA
jgi:8-oxo-dGTP diphosphatase